MNIILNLLFIIAFGFSADYFQPDLYSLSRYQSSSEDFNIPSTLRLVGIMAQFPIEVPDNPKTSGNGQFLSNAQDIPINFFDSNTPRCADFLVDKPPHDSLYFKNQLEAVGNYYKKISNGQLISTFDIIRNRSRTEDGYYTVSDNMEYYAKGDALLAGFFSEALDSAKLDIDTFFDGKDFSPDDVVFVVFHAGLSQDFAYPSLDPTIYDLKSAYIDTIMMKDIVPTIILQGDNSYEVKTGVLLPETQNMIYYNVVEDIFGNPDYGTEDLCDIQIGITGIFAFLLGYELGLPPMFNNDSTSIYYGDSGIGYFGLMDHGSNNGRGVIPALPTPWTRIKSGWSAALVINLYDGLDTIITIPAVDIANQDSQIYKIKIAENEYFLIENRNNWVSQLVDIDSLRRKHKINENQLGHWFDSIIEEFTDTQVQINDNTGVITGFDNYDYGIPGSGILIWHIKEPNEGLYSMGINNDRYNRHVQIEEADGALDIGFESYTFFTSDNPTAGTRWDMWFRGNEAYEFGNPYAEEVVFDNESYPNTRTTDGAASFLSITMLDDTLYTVDGQPIYSGISDFINIKIQFNGSIVDEEIEIVILQDKPIHYLGNSYSDSLSMGSIYYSQGSNIYKYNSLENSIDSTLFTDYNETSDFDQTDSLIFSYNDQIKLTSDSSFCIFPEGVDLVPEGVDPLDCSIPKGYIKEYNVLSYVELPDLSYSLIGLPIALGDIDLDGLDEILYIKDDSLFAYNANNTKVNGFPINGDFSGTPLIANILSIEDNKPEIICRENNDIVIISNRGERMRQLSSFDTDQPLAMVPYWNREKMALIDGPRLFLFDLDMDLSYWLNPRSQPSGFPRPLSTSSHSSSPNQNFGRQKAYNYPNPITEGRTTFRFFVSNSVSNVQVRIYDAAGFLIKDDLELKNPIVNEFNEIKWDNIQVDAGLYLAEIKRNVGVSELVRLVVVK